MPVSTRTFALTPAAYQDVSEGNDKCSFRLPFIGQKNNSIRVHLGTTLPDVNTADHDEYKPPGQAGEEVHIHFTELTAGGRVYVRATRDNVTLRVYRL
jgi:hypothetical protein